MIFENKDYDSILKSMLDKIPDTLDKREGSIIYDALAPAAAELAKMYIDLEYSIDLVFVDTAVDEYLDRLCNQIGIYRNEATHAIKQGQFYDENNNLMDIEINSRFTCGDLYWCAIEKISMGIYKLKCESEGTQGNNITGSLVPVDYIQGLNYGTLTDLLIPGEETETDEALRKRYMEKSNDIAFGGNILDYKQRTKQLDGIGAVKVIPVWNGPGTVKLIILDSDYNKANNYLIETTQKAVCPNLQDNGIGFAPIGHIVTVTTVDETPINVSTTITLSETGILTDVKENIKKSIENYLLELRKTWENNTNLIVRKSQIETLILAIEGVIDVQNTVLNNSPGNIEISEANIPIMGRLEVKT